MSEVSAARRVGRLTLGGTIASGGMASVHAGRLDGTAGFARRVAVKRLLTELADDRHFVEMLLDEARMSACIHHPNVVSTLDVVAEGDEVFVVLEYVHGESLARLVARASRRGERIPVPIAAAVVAGALRGLHAAHEARDENGTALEIVHRDVSPHNILVDTHGRPRLLDFGVAKARGRRQVSEVGALKGKVAYMAPEQIHGQATRSSDVFSMGIVLWETLTGDRLFQGKSDGEVLASVLLAKAPSVRARVPEVSEAFDAAIRKSLHRQPMERFPTALAFAEAIEASCSVAPAAEVAAWLEREAGDSLREREKLFATAEAPPTAARPSRMRIYAVIASVLAITVGAFALAHATRAPAPPAPPLAATPPPPPAPATSTPAPEASEIELASEEGGAAPPAATYPRQATRATPHCQPPYVIDARGHKIWKRECF